MNRNIKPLFCAIAAACLFSCAVRKSEPHTGKVVDTSNARVQHGQTLFNRWCQKCHPAGEAGLGPSVMSKPGFLTRFQARHGLGVMPSFSKDQLSKKDLKDIALYLKQLNKL
jgi:mono/diheme cytochrome c family protein